MSVFYMLSSVALRQTVGEGAEHFLKFITERFTDHSQALPHALQRANERAWKTLEIALAGEGLLNKLDSTEERAFRSQIQALLETMPLPLLAGKKEFRTDALRELRAARQQGMLLGALNPEEMRKTLAAHGSQATILDTDRAALADMGTRLTQANFKNLAHLVCHQVQPDQALLVVAVRYFFRREVESNETLARSLQFNQMETLSESQRRSFQQLDAALSTSGHKVESALNDLGSEVEKIGQEIDELKQMVQQLLALHQMHQQKEVRPGISRSIRGEHDKRRVRELVERYQSLPETHRHDRPDLLNDVALLQVASGQCAEACETFDNLAVMVKDDPTALAQARYNAYRAALEQRNWERALQALREAIQLLPDRYAPFPLEKYEPQRILGAGGFGVAFLCQHTTTHGLRVIKTLQLDGLDRDVRTVFEEARVLESLEHESIIRLRDCDFADRQRTRGYLVMDYFAGVNLGDYVKQKKPLTATELLPLARQVAEAMQAAHERNVWHRDLKPDNLLVRREANGWKVKLIDFGLAVKHEISDGTVRTLGNRTPTPDSYDIAGTLEYAAPEQMGQLEGVVVGPHSDVYGFARTCYFALLGTPQPDDSERESLHPGWRKLLSECTARRPEKRIGSFGVVLQRLREIERPTAPATPRPFVAPPPPLDLSIDDEPIVKASPPPPPPEPPPSPQPRPRTGVPPRTLTPSKLFGQRSSNQGLSDLWGANETTPPEPTEEQPTSPDLIPPAPEEPAQEPPRPKKMDRKGKDLLGGAFG